jgi:8-oxo-dGTP diphosphatase
MNTNCPSVAVDVICWHRKTNTIAVIERKYPPLGLALPGGFIDAGETVEQAAVREMREELNVSLSNLKYLGFYDDPARDPRRHVISFAFFAEINELPVAGDDAKSVRMVNMEEALCTEVFCFDHAKILKDFLERIYYFGTSR